MTRKKIRISICSFLFISYLHSINLKYTNPSTLTPLIKYLINYFINKPYSKIDYYELFNLINNSFNNLLSLLSNFNNISKNILIKLLFSIPIQKPHHIFIIAKSLRD